MSKLPRVTGKRLIAILSVAGFKVVRVRGSHHYLRHEDGRGTVIFVHSGETIGPGLLHKIPQETGLPADELRRLLQRGLRGLRQAAVHRARI